MLSPAVRLALLKFFVACVFLAVLTIVWASNTGSGLGILIVFIVVVALPVTLLIGIDTSRVIKREVPSQKGLRILGVVLGLPQAVFGMILIAFGAVYPLIAVRSLEGSVSQNSNIGFTVVRIALAALGFVLGIYYVMEGLNLRNRK